MIARRDTKPFDHVPNGTSGVPQDRDFDLPASLAEHHEASYAWALACARYDPDEAREVIQATYVKLLEGTARFGQRSSFKTWLFAVIRNTAASRRRRARLRRLALIDWGRGAAAAPAETRPALHPDRRAILAALRALPGRQAEVIELVFYHDLSIEQAAETMGVSVGAARVHYARGKQRLAEELREVGP